MIKIIASDLDGTLLNSKHMLSNYNRDAILAAQEKGLKFMIATGRGYEHVEPILKENNIKCPCILMNGAEFRDEEGYILEKINLKKNTVIEISKIINSYGLISEFYTDKGFFTNATKEEFIKGTAYRILSFEKNISFDEALKRATSHPHFSNIKYIENMEKFLKRDFEIRKVISFFNDINLVDKVKNELNNIPGIAVLSSFRDNIEVTDINAQKGYILSKVIKKMGYTNDEVAVFGDSFNDYSLFTEFNNSYAMNNAIPEIKEIAKYIAEDNHNDGVGKEILKFINFKDID